jgi:hypothetical protein
MRPTAPLTRLDASFYWVALNGSDSGFELNYNSNQMFTTKESHMPQTAAEKGHTAPPFDRACARLKSLRAVPDPTIRALRRAEAVFRERRRGIRVPSVRTEERARADHRRPPGKAQMQDRRIGRAEEGAYQTKTTAWGTLAGARVPCDIGDQLSDYNQMQNNGDGNTC